MAAAFRNAVDNTAVQEVKMGENQKKNFRELLEWAVSFLKDREVPEARRDAWLLMEEVFEVTRSWFFAHGENVPGEEQIRRYEWLVEQRGRRIPLQQLTGTAWFYGMPFLVNEHVLIPRQDTEILVEEARKRIRPGMRILDLCTGSGCVLLALLASCEQVTGTGVDLSGEALAVAEKNARNLKIPAEFLQSDLFEQVQGVYDIIVSNPPYIRTEVIPTLMPEVREHEPWMALDGKEDGLYFYRKILDGIRRFLCPGGWICFEIGYDQGEDLKKLMKEHGLERIEIVRDLAGLDRTALGRIPETELDGTCRI